MFGTRRGREKPPPHSQRQPHTREEGAGAWVWCRLHTQSAPTNDKMTDISDGGTENKSPDVIDVSDSRDFMAQALAKVKEAQASGGKVTVDVPLMSNVSAAVKAQKERAAKAAAIKDAIAAEKGLRPSSAASTPRATVTPPKPLLSEAEQEEVDEEAMKAESASKIAQAEGKAAAKAEMEEAATKATSGGAALQALLKEAAIDVRDLEPDKQHAVPLKWTDQKLAQGVSLNAARDTASSTKRGAQLCDTWITGGKRGMIWTIALALESVTEDTTIGVVGRNFFPSSWEEELAASRHSIVLRCGDGAVSYKGKRSSFVLRPLKSGDKLTLTLDMQTQQMTVELMGKSPGSVLSSLELEALPAELTVAVGFGTGGSGVPQQRVRVVGCTCEKPGLQLNGKRVKDLWDDENVQRLEDELEAKKAEAGSIGAEEAKVASAMGGD